MSHEPLLSAVQDVARALQTAVDALRVVEHHLLSGQGLGGAGEHVLHALAGAKGMAVAALPAEDRGEPAPAQAEASASQPVPGPRGRPQGKPRGRRAKSCAPLQHEVPPDAVVLHCRACRKEVLVVARDTLVLDQDGSDHAQSCPMSRVLSGQEERPARTRRKALGAYSSASPPSLPSAPSPPTP